MRTRLKRHERFALVDKFFNDPVTQEVLSRSLGDEGTVLIIWERNLVVCKSAYGEVHYDLKKLIETLQYSDVMQ